jgi:hypothetical protein
MQGNLIVGNSTPSSGKLIFKAATSSQFTEYISHNNEEPKPNWLRSTSINSSVKPGISYSASLASTSYSANVNSIFIGSDGIFNNFTIGAISETL